VNRKPPELPNIEDATLRACLAPLMDAMNAGGEPAVQASAPIAVARAARPQVVAPGSNDNPLPAADKTAPLDRDPTFGPNALAEWRAQADDDFAAFRMVEVFLSMTDADLAAAVEEFPRQIAGTVARIGRIKRRLASQYDRVTAAIALLDRAQLMGSADTGPD
jgi:hypothetical protein